MTAHCKSASQERMNTPLRPTVVVVGAVGGIGLEVVRQLQSRARVIAVVHDIAQATAIRELVSDCVGCDLADPDSTAAAVSAINATLPGQLDGLVFCAAAQPVGAVELVTRKKLERLFAVNVFGTWQLVQGLVPAIRRGRGRVVLFSSLTARLAAPMVGAYAASKFALEALADALRRELRPSHVSVSLIEPGGVDTAMAAAQGPLVDQGRAELCGESADLYGPMYSGYKTMAEKALKYASSPRDVARVAVRVVIGSRRPKDRYVVGADAKLMLLIAKFVPVRWLDAILVKMTNQR
jgi:NAD(P)-dependent dehydrogenase (short-subunit alcohol dehydrogenase family)